MPQVPGNTIPGAGGYGSYPGNPYRDRYDWIIIPRIPEGEGRHFAALTLIGLIVRNPFVSVAVGTAHSLYHLGEYMYTDTGEFRQGQTWSTSPRGGGPGSSPISTDPPPSVEEAGRLLSRGY